MTIPNMSPALQSVLEERMRQDLKWGEQNHPPVDYLAILVEEIGEFATEAMDHKWGSRPEVSPNLRAEAVQVAAVALAIVEAIDRGTCLVKPTSTPVPPDPDNYEDFPRFFGGRE